MPRSSGRLNLTGALNRNMPPSQLNPLPSEPTSKQASVCRLERELKALREENGRLREQLEDTSSALKEITSEASFEKFDERRVNLLKMQIIQLQRQVLLMTEALGSRTTTLTEVENALVWLSEKFRHYIGMEIRSAEVPVARSDLIKMVDTSESARIKLFKNIENCTKENLSRPQMLMNPFLKPSLQKEYTMVDCCMGQYDSLNLKHVAQLESKLSTLYRELVKVSEHLTENNRDGRASHVIGVVREREGTVVLRACAMARDCAADLLSLSLLFPAAPWPALKKPAVSGVTYESLAPSLPAMPRSKAAEVQRCVTAALKACNHRCHMVSQEAGALREEVRFHQAVYELQLDYVQQAFDALRQGYSEFELSTNELLIQPVKKLLESYRTLKNNTSSQGLKQFLTILKEQEQQWEDLLQKLDTTGPHNESGSVVLSAFGEEFLASLDRLVLARQTQRDKVAAQKEELKSSQLKLEEELRSWIKDREAQHNIAKEMKVKDNSAEVDDSRLDCETSHQVSTEVRQEESEEAITGLRPWLDEQDSNSSNSGGKKKKKSLPSSLKHRKPWQNRKDEESTSGLGLRPWLDGNESAPESARKVTEGEHITGLRPWLDEPGQREDSFEGTNMAMKRKGSTATPLSKDSDVQGLKGADTDNIFPGQDSSRSYQYEDTIHSERSHVDLCRQLEPLNLTQHQKNSPFPSESQQNSIRSVSKRPPLSTDSSTKPKTSGVTHKEKSKGQVKSRNYEPRLYVANRTLSLRRSGSLTKLSEPSFQEQMAALSLASQQALDSSRSNSEQSSK